MTVMMTTDRRSLSSIIIIILRTFESNAIDVHVMTVFFSFSVDDFLFQVRLIVALNEMQKSATEKDGEKEENKCFTSCVFICQRLIDIILCRAQSSSFFSFHFINVKLMIRINPHLSKKKTAAGVATRLDFFPARARTTQR